ncbi:MAG: DinB family protein [Segniliparus sp.]|uniref:DinB family protein n=1 Tax=Segniliparus sp. TaxID=2804064 RepID=UPI003F3BF9EC
MVKLLMGPAGDERSGLVECLAQQQEAFVAAAHGLTDEQARAKPAASELSIAGLVKHVTSVQHEWTKRVLAAPDRPEAPVASSAHGDSFLPGPDETLEILLAKLEAQNAATRRAIEEAGLDAQVPVPTNAPWFPKDLVSWSVRWVALHLVQELARHAGHADIIRESLDGATMYELVAAASGTPETDWLKPWRPPQGV